MSTPTAQQLALNNELFNKQLDNALIDARLPANQLQSMIETVNKTFECDAECQEERIIEELHTKWTDAKNIESTSKQKVKDARSKYFKTANGEKYYRDNISIPEYKKEINNKLEQYQNEFTNAQRINSHMLDGYTAAFTSLERINQLYNNTKKSNKELTEDLDENLRFTNTEERRVWYKYESIERQTYYNNIIFWTYYSLIGLWTILQINDTRLNTFRQPSFWGKLIIFIGIPFIIKYVINLIYYILFYFRVLT